MIYRVIDTGSSGNAVLYFDRILVDIGVSYRKLAPYKIDLVLLTHEHKDHINIKTLETLQYHNPNLMVVCGKHMLEHIPNIKNVFIVEPNRWYNLGFIKIFADELFHDVPNFSWHIIGIQKIFHATDTKHLEGIVAWNYDIYALEHNYDEIKMENILRTSTTFEHGHRSKDTHMSDQYADSWAHLMADNPTIVKLHGSSRYGKD